MARRGYLFLVFLFACTITSAQLKVQGLLTEDIHNPINLDCPQPRFSWQILSGNRNTTQSAYEIRISAGRSPLWQSGKVSSTQSLYIPYGGKSLESRREYNWTVRVWDNHGQVSAWSPPAFFQMALLQPSDWQARWIGFDGVFSAGEKPDDHFTRIYARYLRKEFSCEKKIRKAMAYISGLGLYELHLNGRKAGKDVLAPGPTDYAKRVFYNSLDLTSQIRQGSNAIGVVLGNGRYVPLRQHLEDTTNNCVNYGFPKLLVQLEITYVDGTTKIIGTDTSWQISGDGPISGNSEFDGEDYNAIREFKGWSNAGFHPDDRWQKARFVAAAAPIVQSQLNPPIRVMQTLKPVAVSSPKPGMYIFNTAQNMVGWVQLKVKGKRGTIVKLRFAERLKEDGTIYTENLGDARVTDTYTLKGDGEETWEPSFTYHGFQYIEVTGFPGEPGPDNITCKVVHDNLPVIGKIITSNEVLNKIYHNMYWGIRSNYRGMPTDCPQRDERMGWLGDRDAVGLGESFMFNTHLLYAKWMQDIEDAQNEAGSIPDVAPAYWRMYTDNTTWPAAYVYNIDMLYRQFGDDVPVKKYYASIKKWLAFLQQRYMKEYIITENTYGDWCVPPESLTLIFSKDSTRKTPGDYLSTAFYYDMLQIMKRFAIITGHTDDADFFATLSGKVYEAFNRKFLDSTHYYYANNTTTANVLALAFGLVPEKLRPAVFERVIDNTVNKAHMHISTGLIGIQQLMRTLTNNGRPDIAYQLATNTSYPGWGYMLTQGATTIWELWNGNTAAPAMNSANHVMMIGDLLTWYYENLAGIKSTAPGFREITMLPLMEKDLKFVTASYQSPYGSIVSNWRQQASGGFEWRIEIPANCKAIVYIPAASANEIKESGKAVTAIREITIGGKYEQYIRMEIGSGKYAFTAG